MSRLDGDAIEFLQRPRRCGRRCRRRRTHPISARIRPAVLVGLCRMCDMGDRDQCKCQPSSFEPHRSDPV
ncbi:hypothetical protein LF41_2233 [Lysobacter dokdonensis DS-58]|uniref:Uncharacterized protein n=1 Tax=Lysobacter dokdonensis DS-58 TaxID=1300345 RepID=A0A0A2WIP7_9GAMM|nr:hypothetical protein LF41_2233 [Lysobacter dokdonensis DS-58]